MGEKPSFFNSNPLNKREERAARRFLKKVITAENDIIDARSQMHFDANFFDTNAIRLWEQKTGRSANELKQEIMGKYIRQKTMYGRLALFLSEEYFPYLKAVDLGKTREVQDPTKINNLRSQYREVRSVVEDAFGVTELEREKSGRTIHFRHDALVTENHLGKKNADKPMWFIGERNRPLLRFRYGESGDDVVTLPKRMTFGAREDLPAHLPYPVGMPHELGDDDGMVRDPEQLAIMEDALDRGHPLLPGIRTLYFVAKSKLKA